MFFVLQTIYFLSYNYFGNSKEINLNSYFFPIIFSSIDQYLNYLFSYYKIQIKYTLNIIYYLPALKSLNPFPKFPAMLPLVGLPLIIYSLILSFASYTLSNIPSPVFHLYYCLIMSLSFLQHYSAYYLQYYLLCLLSTLYR